MNISSTTKTRLSIAASLFTSVTLSSFFLFLFLSRSLPLIHIFLRYRYSFPTSLSPSDPLFFFISISFNLSLSFSFTLHLVLTIMEAYPSTYCLSLHLKKHPIPKLSTTTNGIYTIYNNSMLTAVHQLYTLHILHKFHYSTSPLFQCISIKITMLHYLHITVLYSYIYYITLTVLSGSDRFQLSGENELWNLNWFRQMNICYCHPPVDCCFFRLFCLQFLSIITLLFYYFASSSFYLKKKIFIFSNDFDYIILRIVLYYTTDVCAWCMVPSQFKFHMKYSI